MDPPDRNFARLYKMISHVCRDIFWEYFNLMVREPVNETNLDQDTVYGIVTSSLTESSIHQPTKKRFQNLLDYLNTINTTTLVSSDFDINGLYSLIRFLFEKRHSESIIPCQFRKINELRNVLVHSDPRIHDEHYQAKYKSLRNYIDFLENRIYEMKGNGAKKDWKTNNVKPYLQLVDRIHQEDIELDEILSLIEEYGRDRTELETTDENSKEPVSRQQKGNLAQDSNDVYEKGKLCELTEKALQKMSLVEEISKDQEYMLPKKVTGNQPKGKMVVTTNTNMSLEGYEGYGTIEVFYEIPVGETPYGSWYKGTKETCYLPNNEKGKLVAKLLHVAFDRCLVFTVRNPEAKVSKVTWNNIHHKTSMTGGPERDGYPDDEYLDRVLEELEAYDITEESLKDP